MDEKTEAKESSVTCLRAHTKCWSHVKTQAGWLGREAWRTTVHGVAKCRIRLSDWEQVDSRACILDSDPACSFLQLV